ncbi:GntR family transcriptional regulator [Nocardia asiatica]|uniref:GntR family transcriptional regulator n=1 Tax=Nocardia asiatica TaxID=209252 RepID=UPI0002F22638|nr:GntR family transcriptional regulator [Nocardia asiatica]
MSASNKNALPLGEAAYRHIRDDIVACRLAPGERFTERGLAESTGFGASPIREALTRLDHEGLIQTVPRKGYRVKPLTIKAVDDLFEFWLLIAPDMARQGVIRATDAQLAEIVATAEKALRLVNDPGTVRERAAKGVALADRIFNDLADATGNVYFRTNLVQISAELARVWALVIDSELLEGEIFAISPELLPDISARNGDAMAKHVRAYIRDSHLRVLRTLARWPSVITSEVLPVGRP